MLFVNRSDPFANSLFRYLNWLSREFLLSRMNLASFARCKKAFGIRALFRENAVRVSLEHLVEELIKSFEQQFLKQSFHVCRRVHLIYVLIDD